MSEFDQYDEPSMGAEEFEALAAQHGYEIVDDTDDYEPEYEPEPVQQAPSQDDFHRAWHRDVDNHLDELNRELHLELTDADREQIKYRAAMEGFNRDDTERLVFNAARELKERLVEQSRDTTLPPHERRNARRALMARAIRRESGWKR